ncbi:RNA polymerase sigma factor [Plantactinospora sp. KLBMP9567]|uniref:RNA polymerase sigma factor n=1 Tax=Plantactinospora sp. KLBMP9567 TaxID=3085900 RepID=UPI002980FC5D|nr:RNA polymerase sigma factor [Plantactinospora sp. KLBMP9567]MDW5326416.1 RNA polymerase sigma factor [Plantactinospora sp. KLBMP9567]
MVRHRGGRSSGGDRGAVDEAMGELYHACYRRLVAQVYAFTTDLSEAQDVVQEAFARAIARPQGLADVDNPEAWLRTVAVNVVRRRWRRRQLLDTILLRDRPVTRLVETAPGPERTDLREALAGLPVSYREVIVLHYFADLPVEEIATVLGVPTGTVKSRLSRGRTALAARLGDYQGTGGPASTPGPKGRTDPPADSADSPAGRPDPMAARMEPPARIRPAVRPG